MQFQKQTIREKLIENGWKINELEKAELDWWAKEMWQLESVWSPVGKTAYISFLIDPMSDLQNPSVWAIEISDEQPVYGKERNCFLVSLKQWKNEQNKFLTFLDKVRRK